MYQSLSLSDYIRVINTGEGGLSYTFNTEHFYLGNIKVPNCLLFIESAHWADSIIESRCPYVCVCVCVSVPFPCDFLAWS